MSKAIIWTADERMVPGLRRIVKRGDDISDGKPLVLAQLIDQGLAAEQSDAEVNDPPAGGASVPLVITRKMRDQLRKEGRTEAEIDAMTPQQAHDALNPPPA